MMLLFLVFGLAFSGCASRVETPSPDTPLPTTALPPTITIVPDSPLPPTPSAIPPTPTATEAPFIPKGLEPITPDNIDRLQLLAEIENTGFVIDKRFSPDGSQLATVTYYDYRDYAQHLWDLETGQALIELRVEKLSIPEFTPDGKLVVLEAEGNQIILWDSWERTRSQVLYAAEQRILFAVPSPDWKVMAAILRDEFEDRYSLAVINLGDPENRDTLFTHGLDDNGSASFSQDGQVLWVRVFPGVTVLTSVTSVFEVSTGKLLTTQYQLMGSIALSSDGRYLAAEIKSEIGEPIAIYEAHSGQLVASLIGNSGSKFSRMMFSPDGRTLMATEDYGHKVWIWDTDTWREIDPPVEIFDEAIFSPDGKLIVSFADGKPIRFFGVATR
ncbi:MAG: hypothetical protein GTO14_13735 [Anaerolineales bacterium]|nr:hypothetical protein [Anaerolineales bacterium]